MKVALVFPNYLDNFFILASSFQQSLGLAMIAAVLKGAGHEVTVIDATAERLNMHRLEARVRKVAPDVIGITTNVSFARKATVTGKWLKKRFPNAKIVFGGPWATVENEFLLKEDVADYVVIGEGEHTIVELVDSIASNSPVDGVKGIAYKEEHGEFRVTTPREYIQDLDALPFPAWELFPSPRKYFNNTKKRRFFPISTSRGCPLGCIHCSKMIHGYKLRARSVESVIAEIRYLHDKFGMQEIIFTDDNFNHDVDRAEQICDGIIGLDFKIAMCFYNGLRADKIPARLAWKLKEAGTYDVALGVESGNQDIVYKIGKNLDLEDVRRSVRLLKRLGVYVRGFFMIGLPHESIHTMVETKQLAMELDFDIPHFFKVVPFPGTRLHDMIEKKNAFFDDARDRKYFYNLAEPTFELPGLPSELIDLAFDDMNRSFFLRPKKVLSLVSKMKLKNLRWHVNAALILFTGFYNGRGREHPEVVVARIKDKIRNTRDEVSINE